jgi:N-acetyl-anhydromuramyl-L-alanine amidase AmpD
MFALLKDLTAEYPDARIMGHNELEGVHKDCPCFPVSIYRNYFNNLKP